jgi:chromosome segregation protein
MKLKRLVLQGYKTFAGKTEFIFDAGVTAIVGPNGSGKSNVADALRWVLGEQSYSSLRGKRTVDMIFAGSQSRPRAGMASAILTLDNSDGWLPIDFTEVEIGRRAYRSGENEYLLNGQKVRLKDITDLLATSGLAERTYTVIGQGLIDQALSLRADERRALFEEAAGISHYKARRAETLRRLEETTHNLERVHDILAEIRPRLAGLKRQATRARNHEQVVKDLRYLLRIWYGYKWEQAKADLRLAREASDGAEQAWQSSRAALLAQQGQIDRLQQLINRLQETIGTTRSQRDRLREQLAAVRRDVAIQAERQRAIGRQLAEIEQDLPPLEAQRATAESELAAAMSELHEAQAALQGQQSELRRFSAAFEARQVEVRQRQSAVQEAEARQRSAQTGLAQAEGQLSQLRERLQERATEGDAPDEAELQAAAKAVAQTTAQVETLQTAVQALQEERAAAQKERRALIETLKAARRDARDEENGLKKERDQAARLEARADLLDQMRRKALKPAAGAQLIGQFAALVTIPPAHRTALEAALAARLGALVTATRADLEALAEANVAQPLFLAALENLRPPAPPPLPTDSGLLGRASDLVSAPPALQPLAALLLDGVLLAADRPAAYRLAADLPPGGVAAAPDGFCVYAGGLVSTPGAAAADSILAREEAWRAARAALETQQARLAALETAAAQRQAAIQAQQDQVDRLQESERQLERRESAANGELAQAQRALDRARQQQAFSQRRREERAQELARLEARITAVEEQLEGRRVELGRWEATAVQARARLAELPTVEDQQQRQSLQQEVATAQTIVAGRQAVVDSRRATLNQIAQQINRLQERQNSLRRQQTELTLAAEEATQQALQSELARLDGELEPLLARLAENRRELSGLQEKTAELQRHTHELETQYTQTRIRLTQRENQIEGLQERIKADLGIVAFTYDEEQTGATPLPIGEVVEQLPQVDELPADIEVTIQNYRGQIQRMGAINPDAPEEYEETQARHDFLTQQIEDLTSTDARLRKVIRELDELTSRAFAETVEKVNAVFGHTFTQLFGGGAARLVLTDPDDLTISGVDIIARLPNRREQGLALLSGGERSLTASALIFALLKVAPTPFCVMDEVDAALDEANINRFRELLFELSRKSQFVVITHNRGTVQVADTIYGISMQPDSTSQVISIKPEDYVKESLL